MSDPAPDHLAEIRKLYDAALRGTALDGTPVTRWRYFDRDDVGVLLAEVDRLRAAVRRHRDYRGDDRCHADDGELYSVLPEGDTRPGRETAVTLENCARYIECRQTGREYVSPQRQIEDLEVLLAWESGELSEGQANQLLAVNSGAATDPVTVRGMRLAAIAAARGRWERWRACNPPSPG